VSTQEIVIIYGDNIKVGEAIRLIPFTDAEEASEMGRLFATFLVENTPDLFVEVIRSELNRLYTAYLES
jgi:hypothetical protein